MTQCWCPCNCRWENDNLLPNGLCQDCQEGGHEIPSDGTCPSLEALIAQHESIVEQYRTILIQRTIESAEKYQMRSDEIR